MRKIHIASLVAALLFFAIQADVAHAQSTRTWVSGVGDDVNPCSRTAPCKTFAGAMSKTAAGGEINALDPAGYGAVTITKSITIDGSNTNASILSPGTNGVVINAGAADRIILRNLNINGAGTGLNGIRFLAGNSLEVSNLTIANVTQNCIVFATGVKANLLVTNSNLTNCAGGGLASSTSSGGSNLVQINRSTFYKSAGAILNGANSTVQISDSIFSSNGGGGVSANGANSIVHINSSEVVNNTTFGVKSANAAVINVSRTSITGNAGTALLSETGGQLLSWQNNFVASNSSDGAFTGVLSAK